MKKHIYQFILSKGFFVNLLTEKFYGFSAMKQSIFYAGYTKLVFYFISLIRKIIMSKQR